MEPGTIAPDVGEADVGEHAVIVFDGFCALCNGWVDFLLKHDLHARYHFAAMQTPAGRALLASHGLDPDDPMSLLLLDEDGSHTDSDAVIAVLVGLGRVWRTAAALRLLPRVARDRAYRFIARNRYRWFGKKSACYLPTPRQRERFLDA